MTEVLPIRLLTDEDAPIFGSVNILLGKLARVGLPVAPGMVVTAPNLKLKTILEHHNFGSKEVFTQSLTLVQTEINKIPLPEVLAAEIKKHKHFLLAGKQAKGSKQLWLMMLNIWLDQIKERLWRSGFYQGITENLDPQIVIFISRGKNLFGKKLKAMGKAFFDPIQDDVQVIVQAGKLLPADLKKLGEVVHLANKKLLIPYEYEWILDGGLKLVAVAPYTPKIATAVSQSAVISPSKQSAQIKSAVRVFLDLSTGFTLEKNVDGVFIASEKIFDLNKPQDSFESLVFRVVESALTFPNSPILFKLADKSEGMGKIRGSLRLLHQKSLFNPLMEVLDFARHKKGLLNVHIVVPFVRGVGELLQIKRELATKKLMRKASLQIWMEAAAPENIVNLENYLVGGIDGVVLNLNELIAHFNGFDPMEGNLVFYKNEVEGLLKFLEDGIRLLHKSKVPFIAYGSLILDPKVLEFLVERGVLGVVVEKYEAHSANDLLNQTEKRIILRKQT